MFLLNSRLGPFTAAPLWGGHPFSRSYGAVVPSSLTRFLSRALVSLHHPTCVGLRYGRRVDSTGFFSAAWLARPRPGGRPPALAVALSTGLRRPISVGSRRGASCGLRGSNSSRRHGNVHPSSIGYAFRPGLRSRLTPGGRTCPGKPWDSGGRDFHPSFRYSCPHHHCRAVHGGSRPRFGPSRHAPLPTPRGVPRLR